MMRRIIIISLILISAFAHGQVYVNNPAYGTNFKRGNFITVLQIPSDTTLDGTTNPCAQIAKIDNVIYTYNCDSVKWVQIVVADTGIQLALDSARRSNDTLFFRITTGGELAIKMDYYTKHESDSVFNITASHGLNKTGNDIQLGGTFGDDGEDVTVLGNENQSLRLRGTYNTDYSSDDYTSEARILGSGIILQSINRVNGGNTSLSIGSTTGIVASSVKGGSITSTNGDATASIAIPANSSGVQINSDISSTGGSSSLNISSSGNSQLTANNSLTISTPLMTLQAGTVLDIDGLKNNVGIDSTLYTDENGIVKQRVLAMSDVPGLVDTLNARKDSTFWTKVYGSLRPKTISDSVGIGKKATVPFDVAGKSNFDDTTKMHSLVLGGAQPAIPSVYRMYVYGNNAFTGTTAWNGGIYSSRNSIAISNRTISPWSAFNSSGTNDISPVATIGWYRFQASGLGKALYGDYLGRLFFGAYTGSALNSGLKVMAEMRVQTTQHIDTTRYGAKIYFMTTKNGSVPVGPTDSATLNPRTALLLENNQNVAVGVSAINDSAYLGRFQVRADSANSVTQPLIYTDSYLKAFRWAILGTGQEKNSFLATTSSGIALNVLYVDPADSLVKKGILPSTGSTPPVVNLIIPNDVYAVEGAEFNVYNDNIVLSDYGKSDFQYDYVCTKGIQYNNRFSYTPTQADSGTTTLAINVLYKGGVIATKTVNLHSTTRRAGTSTRNVIMGGDSQVNAGTITDTAKANYSSDVMVINYKGTQPTPGGNFMEARGGWQWSDFTTVGRTFYKFIVSGITIPPALNAAYTNNSSTFAAREINLSGGSGYISYERTVGVNAPLSSGTLTKSTGVGDATITYSSVTTVPGNPLWNGTLSRMDVAGYLTTYSITMTTGDWWTWQLGTNDVFSYTDTATLNTKIAAVLVSIDTMINAIQAGAPGTKIALVLPNPPADQDAAGSNYTAGQTAWRFDDNIKRYMKAVLAKYDNSTYQGNGVYVLGGNTNIDTKNNMQFSVQRVNARSTETYVRQINLVHPDVSGYSQFSDSYYALFKWFK